MSIEQVGWLLGWGMLVGLDLISVGQIMISRPLVAGTVAGALLGDIMAGAMVGAILELFALDLLPVGAARYPDYGPGAVVAAAMASGAPGLLGVGLGAGLGLAVAHAGQWGIHLVRRYTARDLERNRLALDGGDPSVIRRLHLRGIARDAIRALCVTAFGMGLALLLRRFPPVTIPGAVMLSSVAIGAALAVAATGVLRLTGVRLAGGWFVAGLVGGSALVWWQ